MNILEILRIKLNTIYVKYLNNEEIEKEQLKRLKDKKTKLMLDE